MEQTLTRGSVTARLPWTAIALGWLGAYAALRAYWHSGRMPSMDRLSPVDSDLVLFTGWSSVAMCVAGLAVVVALATVTPSGWRGRVVAVSGAVVTFALAGSSALLLLDVVGGVLPGLGIEFFPLGAASRAACAGGAALVGVLTLRYARRLGLRRAEPLDGVPRWAWIAAYAAVAGCAVRMGAQVWVGFDQSPLSSGVSALLFEVGFVLAGSALPLAQVHAWGRRLPRRLVVWPGAVIGTGITVYFGLMTLQMVWERLHGRNPFPPSGGLDLPEAFFWVAVPSYLVWGVGLTLATRARARLVTP